jgi:hypothetical protein
MNLTVNEKYLNSVSSRGTQDLGLDIVAWLLLADKIGNYISVFAQCACGKEWNKKLHETRRFKNFLNLYLSEITHSMFIPYSLINYNDSAFFEHHEFGEAILLFDRKRILSLMKDTYIHNNPALNDLVEKCIASEEDIV